MDESRFIYIDVETNGIGPFRPPKQRVAQLAYIMGDIQQSAFINDVKEVSPHVPHPYDVEYLKKHGEDFDSVIFDFYEVLKNATHIVAHNADFDLGCIVNECRMRTTYDKVQDDPKYFPIIQELCNKILVDTMKQTVDICKLKGKYSSYKWPKLEELYEFCFHEKPDVVLHDALNDCIITRRCLNMLTKNNILKLK
jgi:DNA polymerase III epsilon subunit-like protein